MTPQELFFFYSYPSFKLNFSMTHVHYKFSSKLSYDTVVFDGPHITLGDLKRQIMGREKLRAGDCDLQITNGQTKEGKT